MATDLRGYEYEFVDSVFSDFYCRSCGLVARKLTVCTNCMESFCHSCALVLQEEDKHCPVCLKKPVTILEHPKNQKRISSLRVCCILKKRGCDWTGSLEDLQDHLDPQQDNCLYVEVACPLDCPLKISKNAVELHVAQDCARRPYICQHCNFTATYEDIVDNHLPKCKFVAVQCPNRCGVTCEREFMEDHIQTCSLEVVSCEFSGIGCDGHFTREDQDKHIQEYSQKHLAMMASVIMKSKDLLLNKLQKLEERFSEDLKRQERKICEREVHNEELVEKMVGMKKLLEAKEKREEELEQKIKEQLRCLESQEEKLEKLVKKTKEMENELRMVVENQEKRNTEQEHNIIDRVNEKLLAMEQRFIDQNTKLAEQQTKLECQKRTLEQQGHIITELAKNLEKLYKQDEEQDHCIGVLQQKQEARWHDIKQLLLDVSLKSDQNETQVAQLSTHIFLNRTFEMKNFTAEKTRENPRDWKCPAMYTHVKGYKFCIGVDASGVVYGNRNAVGLVIYAMQGEFDDELQWPIKVKLSVELVNQRGSENARRSKMSSLWHRPITRPSIIGVFTQCNGGFLDHSKLSEFLNNDTLYFYVTDIQWFVATSPD